MGMIACMCCAIGSSQLQPQDCLLSTRTPEGTEHVLSKGMEPTDGELWLDGPAGMLHTWPEQAYLEVHSNLPTRCCAALLHNRLHGMQGSQHYLP